MTNLQRLLRAYRLVSRLSPLPCPELDSFRKCAVENLGNLVLCTVSDVDFIKFIDKMIDVHKFK